MFLKAYKSEINNNQRSNIEKIITTFKESKEKIYIEAACHENCRNFFKLCQKSKYPLDSMMVACCVSGTYGGALEYWNHAYIILFDGTQWVTLDYDQRKIMQNPWDKIIPAHLHLAMMLNSTWSVERMRKIIQGDREDLENLQSIRLFTPKQWFSSFKVVNNRGFSHTNLSVEDLLSLRSSDLDPDLRERLEVPYINYLEFDKFLRLSKEEGMTYYRKFDNYCFPPVKWPNVWGNSRLEPRPVYDYLVGLKDLPFIHIFKYRAYANKPVDNTRNLPVPEMTRPDHDLCNII